MPWERLLLVILYPAVGHTDEAETSLTDAVSFVQLNAQQDFAPEDGRHARRAAYGALDRLLTGSHNLSHSQHILEFVAGSVYAPDLGNTGCLYLPSDDAWRSFYEYVEHPYPPLFAELVKNAYDPDCTVSQGSSAKVSGCPDGHVAGSHWQLLEEPAGASSAPSGCVGAKHTGFAGGIRVFETEGHVGLPGKWQHHVRSKLKAQSFKRSALRRQAMRLQDPDFCDDPSSLPEVPTDKKLVVPTRFIICCVDTYKCPVTTKDIEEQVAWMSRGYAGKTPWTPASFDRGAAPPQVNMQIEFDLVEVKHVKDYACARTTFINSSHAEKYNADGEGLLTYVIVTDDQTGVLGMAEFPTEMEESSPKLMVMINSLGLRHYASRHKLLDMTYDEGDTCIHEGGHSLGLLHTFEGGCQDGDQVADTLPEEFPTYTCTDIRSCQSADPVHNFMDYTPDTCMSGFTEQQKRRAWCVIKRHRPVLFKRALRHR